MRETGSRGYMSGPVRDADGLSALREPRIGVHRDTTEGNAPLTVLFVDQSQPGSTDLTNWLWDFGDGLSSTTQIPATSTARPVSTA